LSNITKKIVLQQIRNFKNSIFQFPHLPFSDILTTDILEQITEESASSRDRIFTPLVTLKAFIFQVLSTMAPANKLSTMCLQNTYTKAAQPTQ
jgi:hypothetical protein